MKQITMKWARTPNWGDSLNPILIKKIFNIDCIYVNKNPDYLCIGSILQWAKNNTIVWGTGFISNNSKLLYKPKITAVRGPLTRNIILKYQDCPDIYGDPCLLYTMYYKPNNKKKYKYGIIPHMVDLKSEWLKQFINNKDVKIINIIRNSTEEDINAFIDEVNECEIILSSSLHGIIIGDSLSIPSYWIKLSDNVIGDGFKFKDYLLSVNRPLLNPIVPNYNDRIIKFKKYFYDYKINIDLDKLMNACPFKNIK